MSEPKNYLVTEGEQRGSVMYVHDNYHYRKDRERNDTMYVKCVDCLPPISCLGRGKSQFFSFQVTCAHTLVMMMAIIPNNKQMKTEEIFVPFAVTLPKMLLLPLADILCVLNAAT